MPKSLYSLILSDDIVQAVDLLATQKGFSRSAFINHILADHVSLSTPEQRRQRILNVVEQQAGDNGFRTSFSPGGSLMLHTALRFKYNPSLCYTLNLDEHDGWLGELRVALRSQNETLLNYIQYFFELWSAYEQKYLPSPPKDDSQQLEQKRFIRTLRRSEYIESGQQAGKAIASYVSLLDNCLKTYFSHLDDLDTAATEVQKQYLYTISSIQDLAGL